MELAETCGGFLSVEDYIEVGGGLPTKRDLVTDDKGALSHGKYTGKICGGAQWRFFADQFSLVCATVVWRAVINRKKAELHR